MLAHFALGRCTNKINVLPWAETTPLSGFSMQTIDGLVGYYYYISRRTFSVYESPRELAGRVGLDSHGLRPASGSIQAARPSIGVFDVTAATNFVRQDLRVVFDELVRAGRLDANVGDFYGLTEEGIEAAVRYCVSP